ncbi:glycerophosphodiester phosphodiesterase [Paenibacillus arenilitoris]|uniref:Glycerophosphodiester phosphodiesterase n=1 Tax=Paenibacillus arenilitoris TaxID=2772299 RepID=A0A927CPK2_9BACL|nr:glycerophosphodiester phosphodiesterase [Paenibacillus arenilitoris]MBD2871829.1 glycerophosphodiester phosphodiesterase [Paenibacillus arenilitoris]
MDKPFPLITAHSGCMNKQDHTLESIETGIELGADVIEEDIRATKNRIPVLAHNDEFITADGSESLISQMTLAELRRIKPILTLEEMLLVIRDAGKTANLDLKDDESIEPVAALVKQYNLYEQVYLSGCGTDRAMKVQQAHPELRKLLNANAELFLQSAYSEAIEQTCRDAVAARCFGINIDYKLVRRELLDKAASLKLPVYVWTINEEDEMKRFLDLGVASITARNVQALVNLKAKATKALDGNLR